MLGAINSLVTDIGNKSLDALWMRANAISDNIANNDTPDYRAKTVNFENQLSQALGGGSLSWEEVDAINPVMEESPVTYGANGNGVDMEQQMIELTRNQMQYNYLGRSVADQLSMLLSAARGGR